MTGTGNLETKNGNGTEIWVKHRMENWDDWDRKFKNKKMGMGFR